MSGATARTLPSVGSLGMQLVGDAGLAILVLLMVTTISVYKPWGLTPYGLRRVPQRPDSETPLGLKIFLAVIGGIAAMGVVVIHVAGGGHHH